jgi:type IV pilus assembly protein PilN
MPRINLLPWREELRKQRQTNFAIAAVSAVVLAGLVTLAANVFMQSRIDHQNARNQVLQGEIARLDALIDEIADLERKKERLLARMEIIEELQRRRPDSVHLFDELVQVLPEGVFYEEMEQTDQRLEIQGIAESSTRVSALMRNIESSEYLTKPGLEVVQTVDDEGTRRSQFTVSALQVVVDSETEDVE